MDDGLLGSAPGLSESLNTFRANRHRSGAVEQPGQMLATSPGLEDTVRAGAIEEMFSKSAQNPLLEYCKLPLKILNLNLMSHDHNS